MACRVPLCSADQRLLPSADGRLRPPGAGRVAEVWHDRLQLPGRRSALGVWRGRRIRDEVVYELGGAGDYMYCDSPCE